MSERLTVDTLAAINGAITVEEAIDALKAYRAAILAERDEATLRAIDDYWKGYEAQLAVLRRRIENLEEMGPDED